MMPYGKSRIEVDAEHGDVNIVNGLCQAGAPALQPSSVSLQ